MAEDGSDNEDEPSAHLPKHSLYITFKYLSPLDCLARPDSGTGDIVRGEVGIEAEEDAGVGGSVKRGTGCARGNAGSGASHLKVDALRVGLGSVGVASRVKGNDLMSENIVARSDTGRDGDGPGVAVGNEVVAGPVTRVGATVETALCDLSEGEAGLVDRAAVSVARGEVVNDGAVVRLRPGVPLKSHGATSGHNGVVARGSGLLVANDVGITEGIGFDEAVVLVGGRPADGIGRCSMRNATAVLDAIGDDSLDVTVGEGTTGKGQGRDGSLERHYEVWKMLAGVRSGRLS